MDIPLWFATLPVWLAFIVIVVIPTAVAMLGPVLIRRHLSLDHLMENNEVAGFKFAVLGVLYAVLLGFAVIVVWDKFRDAESAVLQEAGTSLTLARLSDGLPAEEGKALRDGLAKYLRIAISDDWPAMYHGKINRSGIRAVNDLYMDVLANHPTDLRGAALQSEMLAQLNLLTQARRARIVLAEGVVPGVIWAAMFAGAFATVGFMFFFGATNLRAQVVMTGLLTATVFMGMMAILLVNRPFTGDISVGPEPLQGVLQEYFGGG